MEKRHYDKIAMDYPTAASKTFLLNSRGEIDDPYGKSTAVYKQCLDEVTTSVDTLTALLIKAKK
jgi:protein-tyrosine-phosphatase